MASMIFQQMLRFSFLRLARLKRRYVTTGLSLFTVIFIFGYGQVSIKLQRLNGDTACFNVKRVCVG